jgi:hypothetical protein
MHPWTSGRFLIGRRIGLLLAVAAATGLLLAAAGQAQRVNWHETLKQGKANVMTYSVDSITFGDQGWSAHVTFKNVSKSTIGVGTEFGVAFYRDTKTYVLSQAAVAPATTFSKKLPTSLKPGASWSGTIGGAGKLTSSQKVYARVVFGPFSGIPGQGQPIVWITDHMKTLGKGTPAPAEPPVAGPVI